MYTQYVCMLIIKEDYLWHSIQRTNNIKKALQKNETEQPTDTKDQLIIPVFKDEEERTKNYTFSLQPSARKRLDGLAKEHNFKSASKFLNELIKNM